jgi:hypothetical protein
MDEFYNIASTIMRSVQTVKTIKDQQTRISNVKFDRPDIRDNIVVLSNIIITVSEPGEYALIYSANGIYTNIFGSETKIIVNDQIPTLRRYFDYAQTGITIGFCFITLLFSAKFIKGWGLFVSFIFVGLYIFIIHDRAGGTLFYRVAVFVFAALIGNLLLWSFFIFFVDTYCRKRQPGYFFNQKKEFLIEYTYQKLNGHPSSFWVNKKKNLGLGQLKFYNDWEER